MFIAISFFLIAMIFLENKKRKSNLSSEECFRNMHD